MNRVWLRVLASKTGFFDQSKTGSIDQNLKNQKILKTWKFSTETLLNQFL